MNPSTRPRAALLLIGVLAAAVAPSPTRAQSMAPDCKEAQPQSCADCCKLACLEAEILKAKYQQEFYRQIAKRKNLTLADYEAEEKKMGAAAEAIRVASLDGLDTCNYFIPTKDQCYAESRAFQSAGFIVRRDDAGRLLGTSYSVKTDIENCVANANAMDLIPKVAACEGIGLATRAHEEKHVADCKARHEAGQTKALTPAQVAAGEVPGYDAEISTLEQVRLQSALACKERSCDSAKLPWDRNAELLGYLIDSIIANGPPKPAPKSPLARPRQGK